MAHYLDSATYYLGKAESYSTKQILKDTIYRIGPYRVEKWRFQHNLGVVYGNYAYLRKAYYEDLKGAITFNRKANELQETATYYKYIPGPSINLSKYYRQLHELDSLGEYPFALDSALYFANQAKIIADSMDLKAT